MTFAWPCLLPKMCVDPATKYHGHLLLSHIIAKFAIHKRIVLQVPHSQLQLASRLINAQPLPALCSAADDNFFINCTSHDLTDYWPLPSAHFVDS